MVKSIPVDVIQSNPLQPDVRTNDRALCELWQAVEESGIIAPLQVVDLGNGRYVLADGHRRLAVAKLVDQTKVACCVYPQGTDPTKLFLQLNKGNRKINGREYLTIWNRATNKEAAPEGFPAKIRRQLNDLVLIFGASRVHELAERSDVSPHLAVIIRQVENVFEEYRSVVPHSPSPRELGEWMLRHDQQGRIKHYFQKTNVRLTRKDVREFYECITRNEPYFKKLSDVREA